MERKCDDWIETYLNYTEDTESPECFNFWSAISTLASTLKMNCYIPQGSSSIFPNLYIILVAESAWSRKSSAVRKATKLMEESEVEIAMVKEKLTLAFLYRFLHDAQKNNLAAISILASELATLLGKDALASGLISTLTSVYDGDEVQYRTKGSGNDIIRNPCVNLLGATTLDWMSNSLPGESVEGGFTSRVIFVVGIGRKKKIPWPSSTEKEMQQKEDLIADLENMSMLKGSVEVDQGGRDYFSNWYCTVEEPEDPRLKGFYGRFGDHVKKVALILSISEGNDLIIKERHIKKAINELTKITKLMPVAFSGVAFSRSAKDIDRVLNMIKKNGGSMAHSKLLTKNSCYLNATEMAEIIKTLTERDAIEVFKLGRQTLYTIKEEKKNE